jgi:hypothetical protein
LHRFHNNNKLRFSPANPPPLVTIFVTATTKIVNFVSAVAIIVAAGTIIVNSVCR